MAQQGGGGGQADNSYQILWLTALIVFVGFVGWIVAGEQLKEAFLVLKRYQLITLDFVLKPFDIEEIQVNTEWIKNATREDLTIENAQSIGMLTSKYWSFVYALLFVFFAVRIFFKNPLMRYRKKYNMKSLAQQEQKIWPQIRAAMGVDLIAEDLDTGPWGMALTPMQFAKKYKLMEIEYISQETSFSKQKAAEFNAVLIRDRAERAFSAQLGRIWRGTDMLPLHRRAIFTALAARAGRDSDKSKAFVGQLSRSATEGKLNIEGMDELLKKHVSSREIKDLCAMHAYELTVIASLLQLARQDGVLASADFLWVKPLDRRLWYVLNNVGRQTPAVEVGGIFNHWYHECALKRPLSMPVVEGAVHALDIALKDVLYNPDQKERDEIIARAKQQAQAATT